MTTTDTVQQKADGFVIIKTHGNLTHFLFDVTTNDRGNMETTWKLDKAMVFGRKGDAEATMEKHVLRALAPVVLVKPIVKSENGGFKFCGEGE